MAEVDVSIYKNAVSENPLDVAGRVVDYQNKLLNLTAAQQENERRAVRLATETLRSCDSGPILWFSAPSTMMWGAVQCSFERTSQPQQTASRPRPPASAWGLGVRRGIDRCPPRGSRATGRHWHNVAISF
jgi:hypothetical protein